jgi:hypothetical protein
MKLQLINYCKKKKISCIYFSNNSYHHIFFATISPHKYEKHLPQIEITSDPLIFSPKNYEGVISNEPRHIAHSLCFPVFPYLSIFVNTL